jgi:hypothetical protein
MADLGTRQTKGEDGDSPEIGTELNPTSASSVLVFSGVYVDVPL